MSGTFWFAAATAPSPSRTVDDPNVLLGGPRSAHATWSAVMTEDQLAHPSDGDAYVTAALSTVGNALETGGVSVPSEFRASILDPDQPAIDLLAALPVTPVIVRFDALPMLVHEWGFGSWNGFVTVVDGSWFAAIYPRREAQKQREFRSCNP